MSSNINKKRISLFKNRKFLKYIYIFILLSLFVIFSYHELIKKEKFYVIIKYISEKYNYQLINIEINSLQRVNKLELNNIINQYYNQSIFYYL